MSINIFDSLSQADESEFDNAPLEHDLVGQRIASFEIMEMVGRGGMGVVWRAHDTRLKRSVAVKSMPVKLKANPTAQMRFRREAELLASLNHPNIAVIHEIVEEEESGYLILEYVPGETLAERIAHGPLKLDEVLSISRQIAKAISAAHKKGIVHRDLKPGNIKITPDGQVKVLDFGLAKELMSDGKNYDTTVTQAGRVLGTPAYMSPEQARGKEIDHRTDIWSFGCIMFQMLTGHIPFEGETATDTLARIIEREPDWEMLPCDTPANIRTLLHRCLAKNPDSRLGDVAIVAEAIDEALSLPITSRRTAVGAKLQKVAIILAAPVVIILCAAFICFILREQPPSPPSKIGLVVLPFENLGPAGDEHFASGMTDEVRTRLGSMHGLRVIARQSAMQYKDRERSSKEIGEELGVAYILEGSIQRERPSDPNSRVRIRPQLVRVSDDTQVWAQSYDSDMSEVFRLQSDLAGQVARALDIILLEPERQLIASQPTENTDAYNYYLRGREYQKRDSETDWRIAIGMYEKAVELDPSFVLGYTGLSRVHALMYWNHDRSEERLGLARESVHKALELDPDLPRVHQALGCYYYLCHLDYDRALEEFAIARKSMPNDASLLAYIAFVYRRQGKIEKAKVTLEKALELDPRSAGLTYNTGETLVLLRKYPEAEPYFDRAISLAPDQPFLHAWKMRLYLIAEGSTKKARAVLEEAPPNIGSSVEDPSFAFTSVLLDVFEEKYKEALEQLSSWKSEAFATHFHFVHKKQLYAQINGLMGNRQLEQAYYESVRSILESKIQEQPEDARLHSSLGIAYAGLGRKEDAIREGKRAVELLPVSKDAYRGVFRVEDLARIYVMVGDFNAAIDKIKYLLDIPGIMSIHLFRLDPIWAPLRNHPRFQEALESDQ